MNKMYIILSIQINIIELIFFKDNQFKLEKALGFF